MCIYIYIYIQSIQYPIHIYIYIYIYIHIQNKTRFDSVCDIWMLGAPFLGGHLGTDLVLTWHSLGFLGLVWGNKLMQMEFWGRSVLWLAFWSEAGAAGRQKYRFRERGGARNTIRPQPVCMCSGTHFHTPKLMFWANVPDNWSTVCALFP